MTVGGSPFNFESSIRYVLKSCAISGSRTGQTEKSFGPATKFRWAAPRVPRLNPAVFTRCWCVMLMAASLIKTCSHAKQAHAVRLAVVGISEAIGHTIEVRLKSYARFKPNASADIVATANA